MIKGIVKLFRWFFNVVDRYDDEKRKYVKSGYVGKIFSLLLTILTIVFVGACAYGTLWLFTNLASADEGFGAILLNLLKIIAGVILGSMTVGFAFQTVTILIQNIIIAFASAKNEKTLEAQAIDKVVEKVEEAIQEGEQSTETSTEEQTASQLETVVYEGENKKQSKRQTSKGFDIFYAIANIVLLSGFVGIIAVVVVLLKKTA